jgi:hypothetical protein
MQGDKS